MDTSRVHLPPLFVSHGSPMTAVQPGPAGDFWQRLGRSIDARFGRPAAILTASAHTATRDPVLLGAARHDAIHDFGGFPDELYRLRYDAPGAPEIARQAQALLGEAGIAAQVADQGGLDHGAWVPLRWAWPQADVPVLPLAWPMPWTPAQLVALGRALGPLAAQGVLIVASGSLTHNLRWLFGPEGRMDDDAPERADVAQFRDWVREQAEGRHWEALADWARRAPHGRLMHPTDEHWRPWYIAQGAGGTDHPARRLHASVAYGSLAMDAYAFGPSAGVLAEALAADQAPLAPVV